jgi:4-diphosphocytidyl-2-C-methyl-D-erythritol kinase
MVVFPPCKINLGLNILSKRTDGFHDIETCFYPVPWTDILEILPSDEFVFNATGLDIAGNANDNLCVRAYNILRTDFSLGPVRIHLHKLIPSGAGLGGGSSDAAAALTLLNQIFNLNLSKDALRRYASVLGSDCAFFVEPLPMLGSGRGEVLDRIELNLEGKFLVLVKPDAHISTAEAYASVIPGPPPVAIREVLSQDISHWKDHLNNDFEKSVFQKYPAVRSIKETLYGSGARYASMTGSGSAVYGIFDEKIDLRDTFRGVTCWSGYL